MAVTNSTLVVLHIYSLVLLVVLVMAALSVFTGRVGDTSWGVTVLLIAVVNVVVSLFSHRIILMPRTENRNHYLCGVASEQAQLMDLPMPKVIESPFSAAASATGRSPQHAVLAVNPALMCKLDRRELAAVLAHEMAHVRNRDSLVGTVILTLVGVTLAVSILVGFPWWIGAIVLLLPAMYWRIEFRADITAANMCGDPIALASALKKLYRSNFLSSLFPVTHPPTTLRVWILEWRAKRNA